MEVAAPGLPRRRGARPRSGLDDRGRGRRRCSSLGRCSRCRRPFWPGRRVRSRSRASLLPEALAASLVLAAGVGVGTLAAWAAAWPCSSRSTTFPAAAGSTGRWCSRSRSRPTCSCSCCSGSTTRPAPLQTAVRGVFGDGARLPGHPHHRWARSSCSRSCSTRTCTCSAAARSSGSRARRSKPPAPSGSRTARRCDGSRLPLARPALAAGAALAVMEALADFGAVNLLGYRALTDAIYRVWYGAFDQVAALQLATVLVGLALSPSWPSSGCCGAAPATTRRSAAATPSSRTGSAARPRALATALPVAACWPLVVGLAGVADARLGDRLVRRRRLRRRARARRRSTACSWPSIAAVRRRRSRRPSSPTARGCSPRASAVSALRLSGVGYAVPGSVAAVAVYVPLAWLDRRLPGLLLTGTMAGLVLAYLVRFHALALLSVESRLTRIDPSLDDAARSLGADRSRLLAEVHLPLLGPGIATAALLVFVEVLKELPATALLRPLGGDTLAIAVWEATKESRFDVAALARAADRRRRARPGRVRCASRPRAGFRFALNRPTPLGNVSARFPMVAAHPLRRDERLRARAPRGRARLRAQTPDRGARAQRGRASSPCWSRGPVCSPTSRPD